MSSLEETLVRIVRLLDSNGIPYMVIGGMANLFYGVPRTTVDIDITLQVGEKELQPLIEKARKQFQLRVEDPTAFVSKTHVLPLEDRNHVLIDLIVAQLPYERRAIARARKERVQGTTVRICAPEDLIVHKIVSERPRDREDVRGLIARQAGALDRKYLDPLIADLSKALARPEMMGFYQRCFAPK